MPRGTFHTKAASNGHVAILRCVAARFGPEIQRRSECATRAALAGSMASEISHTGVVRVIDIGSSRPQILWHRLTGEAVSIDGGRWSLEFDDEGTAYLSPEEGGQVEPRWANSLLDMSVHQEESGARFIYSRRLERALLPSDGPCELSVKAVQVSSGACSFAREVYLHPFPVGNTGASGGAYLGFSNRSSGRTVTTDGYAPITKAS